MFVHSHHIHWTTQKMLKETIQSNYQIGLRFHFYTHINIASFNLLIS